MSEHGKLYALLIGIDQYASEAVRKLQFAVADVLAFRDTLQQRLGLVDDNCLLLASPQSGSAPLPRCGEVLRVLTQFSKAPMGPDDTFLLYFAGHGFATRDKSYLLTVDSEPALPELLEETAISLETLTKFARLINAGQQLWFLDACRNEPTTLNRDVESAVLGEAMSRDIVTLARQRPESRQQSQAIVSACWQGQVSYEYRGGGHGWFCHHLLACLKDHDRQELDVADLTERIRERIRERMRQCLARAAGSCRTRAARGRRRAGSAVAVHAQRNRKGRTAAPGLGRSTAIDYSSGTGG